MSGTMLAGCGVSTSKKDSGDNKNTEATGDEDITVLKDEDMKNRE